jgi:PAS domain S-box-containing protein
MARDVIIQNMQSGVIVLDHDNRIVDLNPKGRRMTGAKDEHIVGETLTDVVDPALIKADDARFLQPGTIGTFRGVWVEVPDGQDRCYDIMLNSIGPAEDDSSGRVALINDVTDRERRKEKLEQRTQEFDLLRQVQSRILRHNIRNDLTMIRGGVEQLTEDVEQNPHAKGVLEATDDLMSISEKVQLVEDVIDTDAHRTEYDLRSLVEAMAEQLETQYPGIDIDVRGPRSCRIEAITRLEVAIENILENAVEHNDSADPHVSVRITDDNAPSLTIVDNGPGIPDQEVTVLEAEEETSLEHGSSIGLWLIKWIVDRSDATLEFETSSEGTDVTLQFTENQRIGEKPRSAASTRR